MKRNSLFLVIFSLIIFQSCDKDDDNDDQSNDILQPKMMNFRFHFDPAQIRLNSFGEEAAVPANHGAQSPSFNQMSAHYVELCPSNITPLGAGEVLYSAAETDQGGATAIDFNQSFLVAQDEIFFSIPIFEVSPGEYPFLRVSLAYQNYTIQFLFQGNELEGTLASFIGFNTYVGSYTINQETVAVNGNKLQGYWGFEALGIVTEGQAPEGATTVVNPLFLTSSVPAGSCVVTGEFEAPLQVTGNETEDINIRVSLSTNNSFEWQEVNADGKFEPAAGEQVVDMGIRGMIPSIEE